MRFSIRVNNDLTLPEYVAMAQAAEAPGFDQFWVSNDLFLRSAPVIMAAIGMATSRIEIGGPAPVRIGRLSRSLIVPTTELIGEIRVSSPMLMLPDGMITLPVVTARMTSSAARP